MDTSGAEEGTNITIGVKKYYYIAEKRQYMYSDSYIPI